MPSPDTRLLADLIRAKRACLLKVRDLGRKQAELIGGGSLGGLLDLLAAKGPLLARLQEIEQALDPYRREDPETRRWPTPEDRRRCAADLDACESLLAEIVRQEKEAEAALIERRDATALRLDAAHRAGRARGAYTQLPAPTATQLDLTSDV